MLRLVKNLRTSLARMTREQRAALVFLALGGLLWLAIKLPTVIGVVVVFSTLVMFIKALLLRIWELGCQIRRPLFRRAIRIIRAMRNFFAIAPEVEFLHVSTILLVLVSFAYILATKNPSGFNMLGQILLGLICIAATVDTGRQVVQLTRITWARTIGKIILAGVGAALFYVATAISKQVAHGITASDPKYYSEFSGLFAALALPILYLLLGSLVLGLWAVVQLVIAFIVMVLGGVLSGITSNTLAWKLFLYRLQQGKRPPQSYRAPTVDFRWIVLWMRPVSLILSVGLILSALVYLLNEYGKSLEVIAVKSLVALEYRRGSKCLGLPAEAEVAYLERGMISVSKKENGQFKFSTQNCELPKE